MGWFSRTEHKEIWDEAVHGPLGDIDAAHRIRLICRSAADSADKVRLAEGKRDSRRTRREAERFERAAKAAMQIAIAMSDDLLRDASVRQIVDICMRAGDMNTARILLRAVQSASMREEMLNDHPSLGPS